MRLDSYHTVLADGSVQQVHPLLETRAWCVPERGKKPVSRVELPVPPARGSEHSPEDYCVFCENRYFETSPEKIRVVEEHGEYVALYHLPASQYFATRAEFRRLPNLFEIVSMDYWKQNYGHELSAELRRYKENYMAEPAGRAHVEAVLRHKLAVLNHTTPESVELREYTIHSMADALFGGGHELVVPRRHWTTNADGSVEMCSSGALLPEQHAQYMALTVESMADIVRHNRYARYVSVFQNWLAPAGASFDHLHKQLVAIDEWGAPIERYSRAVARNVNVFNDYIAGCAAKPHLVLAENDSALAMVSIGRPFPAVEVYSRSQALRPWDHNLSEQRAMSDIVHSVHKALGSDSSCNEEWYYTPLDSEHPIPWHIVVQLRLSTSAGFEGSTGIHLHPVSPAELRRDLVSRLYALRAAGSIVPCAIGDECRAVPLQYNTATL